MSIVHCPGCSFRVRVPSDATDETWLRCPACRAEYQYSAILGHEPPELEVISGPSPVAASAIALGAMAPSDQELEFGDAPTDDVNELEADEFQMLTGDSPAAADAPDDQAWTKYGSDSMMKVSETVADDDDDLFGERIAPPSEDAEPSERKFLDFGDDGAAADDGMRADFQGFGHDDSAPMTFHADQPDSGPEGVPEDGEDFGFADAAFEPSGGENTIQDASAVAPRVAPVPAFVPRRKKKSGIVGTLLGVVGGGLFGLLIAYYGILMWVLNMDPLKIAKQLPDWVPQAMIPEVLRKPAKPPVGPLAMGNQPEDKDPVENDPTEKDPTEKDPSEKGSPDPAMPPENGDPAMPADPGITPDPLPTEPADPLAIPIPTTPDPVDPGIIPDNPPAATDPTDPFANPTPVKPGLEPIDPFGPEKPAVPEPVMPEKPAAPEKPADPPAAAFPLMLTDAAMPVEELDVAIATATDGLAALVAKPTDTPVKINAYRNLSRLAEVAGNLKSWGETPEQSAARLAALGKVYDELAMHPEIAKDLGGLAGFWLTIDPKKRNNGILLDGALGEVETIGTLFKTPLTIAAKVDAGGKETAPTQKVMVVSEKRLIAGPTGNAVVLGVIVENPTKQIPQYQGENERVIWSSVASAPAAGPMSEPKPAVVPPAADLDDPFATPPATPEKAPATPEPEPSLELPTPTPENTVEPDPFK